MRLKSTLICSVTLAALALAAPAPVPFSGAPAPAYAATNVSISINTFYNDLEPHGSWVNFRDDYVFVPDDVGPDWRPYTVGHWTYTKRHGWLWVSEEPFGWATFHYGRWGHDDEIGWYWVPGTRWAPAWVSWRRSADHVVWAPLPPRRGADVSVEISVGDIPDYYWVAVPAPRFLEANISLVVIDDDRERVRVVERAEPVGSVTIVNNVVVNNVIDVDYVEKETKKDVKVVEVRETDDPKQAGTGDEGSVAVFTPEVKADAEAKPAEVKKIEEVKQGKADGQDQPEAAQEALPAEQPVTETEAGKKPESGEATKQAEQPATGKKMNKQQTEEQAITPPAGEQQGEDQSAQPAKKKKLKTGAKPAQTEDAQPAEATGQPVQDEPAQQQAEEQPAQQAESPAAAKKPKQEKSRQEPAAKPEDKPAGECDPATGAGCPQ